MNSICYNNNSVGVPTITNGSLANGDIVTWNLTFDTRIVGTNKSLIPACTINDCNSGKNFTITFVNNTTGAAGNYANKDVETGKTVTVSGLTIGEAAVPTIP
jgi:hypothetical protein